MRERRFEPSLFFVQGFLLYTRIFLLLFYQPDKKLRLLMYNWNVM
jgi:hypothetical protein